MQTEGRRIYLAGNTFPIKSQIKSAGGHWDNDRKMWWIGTGKKEEIEKAISTGNSSAAASTVTVRQEETGENIKVKGKARYKGHIYFVVWSGTTSRGEAFKLAFRAGSKVFWADAAEVQWEKYYQEREWRGRKEGYPTIGSINSYAERMKTAAKTSSYGDAGWMNNGCADCRQKGDWCDRCAFDEFDN